MDLLSSNDKASFSSALLDIFDTFSKDIVIWRRPGKTVISEGPSYSPAYKEDQPAIDITYTSTNISCKASARYIKRQTDIDKFLPLTDAVKLDFSRLIVRLKFLPANLADIQDSEQVNFEGKSYEVVSTVIPRFVFSSQFYIVYIQEKK